MKKIEAFDLEPGDLLSGKYQIVELLGKGWEGEVYLIKELSTGIERAAKFFYPHRNPHNKISRFYARKLHKLRNCDILIKYSSQEQVFIQDKMVTYLISEYIEGELLSDFLKRQPGKHLNPFSALHLLHALADGLDLVHQMGEYHGDLHTENIMVLRTGLSFELKVIDLYHWGKCSSEHIKDDVVDLVNIFYDILGGKKHYSKLPNYIKDIICGRKRSLILSKFKTAGQLRDYIENLEWE